MATNLEVDFEDFSAHEVNPSSHEIHLGRLVDAEGDKFTVKLVSVADGDLTKLTQLESTNSLQLSLDMDYLSELGNGTYKVTLQILEYRGQTDVIQSITTK